ncbi:acyl-CoA dehydrogenase family protein [Blastomonas fulva]|uniref:acyl-CoA dehydrogenase family protein n=1 Tax=Blastomonas fulva TaxID=1550728 RepID=UPI0025A44562|nr:acyl-CoA dehydrogenase family protein [Blastomonas fulva]MDM7927033.1 acyl-CoA dehydrogenase family protein [Blastomonas fulva]MDM7967716.1 acyl-CoA dehydrogenase family protein [Blastomonas fulva]
MAFSEGNLADHLGALSYSEEQIELMDVATNFCRDRSPIDKVRKLIEDEHGYDPAVWQEIVDLGWMGIAVPEAQGGVGLSMAEVAPIAEQMGRRLLATPFATCTIAAQALLAAGDEAQCAEWLPRIVAGEVATLALTEPHGDWNLGHVEATAKASGDGYVLSGTKQFVVYAQHAALVIASVTVEGAVRLALIERSAIPDSALRREIIIDETKRSYELTLDGITIPASALLDAGRSGAALTQIELSSALLQAAEMCGGTQSAIDYTIEYLKTRKQFGKLIGEYQALKHPITNAYVGYEKARSHMLSAAHNFGQQGVGEIAVRMAKASADKAYSFAADRAVQFHGGFGFTHDCDAGLYRRSAIWHASQYGDAAWHRAKLADLLF